MIGAGNARVRHSAIPYAPLGAPDPELPKTLLVPLLLS